MLTFALAFGCAGPPQNRMPALSSKPLAVVGGRRVSALRAAVVAVALTILAGCFSFRGREETPEAQLLAGLTQRRAADVRRALERGANPHGRDREGVPHTLRLAEWGDQECRRLFEQRGAKFSVHEQLFFAVRANNPALVRDLIAGGASVRAAGPSGEGLLMAASEMGHVPLVRLLLDAGALVNHRDRFGFGPLAAAIGGDHPEVVKLLLQRGANPLLEIQGSFCGFADHFLGAVSMRRLQIVPILLDGGANIRAYTEASQHCDPKTALHLAIENQDEPMVRLLLSRGAELEKDTPRTGTPLMFAVSEDTERMVRLLLSLGANPRGRSVGPDWLSFSPLAVARSRAVSAALKKWGAVLSAEDRLVLGIRRRNREDIASALAAGADPNIGCASEYYTCPLSLVAAQGEAAAVRLLLDAGARVDGPPSGWSPLREALDAYQPSVAVVQLLIARGANLRFLDRNEHVLENLARRPGGPEVLAVIRAARKK